MPYIRSDQRLELDQQIIMLLYALNMLHLNDGDDHTKKDGSLNYIITKLLSESLQLDNPKYHKFNTAIGILECAKMELYRRLIASYEDEKIKENGDVF